MKNNAKFNTSIVLYLARIPTVSLNAEGFLMIVSMVYTSNNLSSYILYFKIVHVTVIVQMVAVIVPILFVSVVKTRHLKIKII